MAGSAAGLLRRLRNGDGGYPPVVGARSEAEPTALAALALDDLDARRWLEAAQRGDGSFLVGPPAVQNDAATPLAALALTPGAPRERALNYLVSHRGKALDNDARFPHDPATRGWGWTAETFGWVEPTARAMLALRVLRPSATDEIGDARRLLADRECLHGGWNYGNREVLGTDLEPYLQTTAAAVMALQDSSDELVQRGLTVIDGLWRLETGGLGLAMATVALRLLGADTAEIGAALENLVAGTGLLGNVAAIGWAALAQGAGADTLKVPAR